MGARTAIEWTESSWTPIRASRPGPNGHNYIGWHCEHASPGCVNCYAEGINKRLGTHFPFKPGHRKDVSIFLDEKMLLAPLRWKKPRKIFVCSMTDLFADFVPDEMIDRIFTIMALCPQHTFQVLTKRSARMRSYLNNFGRIGDAIMAFRKTDIAIRHGVGPNVLVPLPHLRPGAQWFPFANVWLGLSVEDQTRADERIPDLLATPAAVRFLSCEPLLGPINLTSIDPTGTQRKIGASGWSAIWKDNALGRAWIDWVIAGGESGPKARPCHPDWARSLRDQCAAAGVPYFWKQWGEWAPLDHVTLTRERTPAAALMLDGTRVVHGNGPPIADLARVGKKAAGRLLDGVEHNGFPS